MSLVLPLARVSALSRQASLHGRVLQGFHRHGAERQTMLKHGRGLVRCFATKPSDVGLGGRVRPRRNVAPDDLSDEAVAEVEKIIHPDVHQNKLDKFSFSIEMSEDNVGHKVVVRGMGGEGFFVNNEFVKGSIIAINDYVMSWNVESLDELTIAHFELARHLDPPPELILIGSGAFTEQLDPELLRQVRKIARVEVVGTEHAISTFNLMNVEDRIVFSAMLAVPDDQLSEY
eukprot:CAMPEP_0184541610 /NCGR_PEP_ID=MMETSP0199_2-20130426/1485_1 /TAXON_ID=1112570 /ORGANISM="Thraustochytrium sp., Strain LLF1b" /LENGTH=230 /DNA_ID=CAMNT_0026935345 /DNA_START=25 /DNA_END=717 /DNA_ORIENTATION=-